MTPFTSFNHALQKYTVIQKYDSTKKHPLLRMWNVHIFFFYNLGRKLFESFYRYEWRLEGDNGRSRENKAMIHPYSHYDTHAFEYE